MRPLDPSASVVPVEELLERCAIGDGDAWATLVGRYERLVYAIPMRLGLRPEDAADVAQETFAVLLASLTKIERPGALGSWLMTVARRLSWRRRSSLGTNEELQEHTLVESEAEQRTVGAIWLYGALEKLGEPCSTLIHLLFLDPTEPSYTDVASHLGCAIGTIGPLRARCLARMRDLLSEETPER